MIVELQIKLKHYKQPNPRVKSFFFNTTDKGVLFSEDDLNEAPLYVFKTLDLDIINFIDYKEEGEDIISANVIVNGDNNFIKMDESNLKHSLSDLNSILKNMQDFKEPENVNVNNSFQFQMFIRKKNKEQKTKVKNVNGQTKYTEYKVANITYLLDDNVKDKFLITFIKDNVELKYIFDDLDCCCFKSATSSFVELLLGLSEDYETDYYFYHEPMNTKLWFRSMRGETSTHQEMILAYIRGLEYNNKI